MGNWTRNGPGRSFGQKTVDRAQQQANIQLPPQIHFFSANHLAAPLSRYGEIGREIAPQKIF
ncbi:hypothetical protein [Geobacillus thermocatenulatus]|uniref:hypothetical protein n=1 Tax=Geobacillus thermocatenulatus TaxID=33938 RepID=UPI000B2DD8D6|nr:hypothetical protein [Geobacillus thermocatenulatus]